MTGQEVEKTLYSTVFGANAKPIYGKYSDPNRRIRSSEFPATAH
jgi:hypothetical protein